MKVVRDAFFGALRSFDGRVTPLCFCFVGPVSISLLSVVAWQSDRD